MVRDAGSSQGLCDQVQKQRGSHTRVLRIALCIASCQEGQQILAEGRSAQEKCPLDRLWAFLRYTIVVARSRALPHASSYQQNMAALKLGRDVPPVRSRQTSSCACINPATTPTRIPSAYDRPVSSPLEVASTQDTVCQLHFKTVLAIANPETASPRPQVHHNPTLQFQNLGRANPTTQSISEPRSDQNGIRRRLRVLPEQSKRPIIVNSTNLERTRQRVQSAQNVRRERTVQASGRGRALLCQRCGLSL